MKIAYIEIEGFLSYAQKQEVLIKDLDLASITGVNGTGKTSLIQSLTWCLFGDLRYSGGDNTTIINDYCDEAIVSTQLRDKNNVAWNIERSLARGGTTKIEITWWSEEDQSWTRHSDHRATHSQQLIYEIIGFDEDAFYSLSYIKGSGGSQFIRAGSDSRRSILMSLIPSMNQWSSLGGHTSQIARDARRELGNKKSNLELIAENEESSQNQIEKLESALKNIRSESQIKKDIDKTNLLIQDLEHDLDDSNGERRKSSDKLDALRSRREAENTRIQSKIENIKISIGRITRLEKTYDESEETYNTLKKAIREMEDRLDILIDSSDEQDKDDQEQIKSKTEHLEELKTEISDSRIRKDNKEKELIELDERDKLLQVDSAVCFVCQAPLSKKKVGELHDEIEDHRHESHETIDKSEEIIKGHRRTIMRLEDEIDVLERGVTQRASETRKLESSIDNSIRERKALKKALNDIDDELEGFDELEDLEKERDKLRESILSISDSEKDLEEEISSMDKGSKQAQEMKTLKSNVKGFEIELEETQNTRSRLETYKEVLTKQQGDLAEATKDVSDLNTKVDDYDYIAKACSPRGLPNILLSDILVQLQDIQNDFLMKLPGSEPMAIEYRQTKENKSNNNVKDVLDIFVHMPNGAVRPIESLSSGEIIRLTLTNQLAMIHFFNQQNGDMIRNIFLDESLGVLDKEVVPVILGTLQGAVASGIVDSILVIAHDQNVIDALPQNIHIYQEKDENSILTSKIRVTK